MGTSQISCCLTHTPIRENSSVGFMLIGQNPQPAQTLARPRNVNTYWTPLTPIMHGRAGSYSDVIHTPSFISNDIRELVTTGRLGGDETFREQRFASTKADFGEPTLNLESSLQEILDMARKGRLTCTFQLYSPEAIPVALWVAHTWAIEAFAGGNPELSSQLLEEQVQFFRHSKDNESQLAKYLSGEIPDLPYQNDFGLFIESTSTLCNPTAYGRTGPYLGVYLKYYGRLAKAPLASRAFDVLVEWDPALRWTCGFLANMQDSHTQLHPAATHGQDESISAQVALAQAILDNATKVDRD